MILNNSETAKMSSASSSSSAAAAAAPATNTEVYSIRVPKNANKKYHIMRFNGNLGVDFSKWRQVKMERENNMKEFKAIEEDQPKFGAGSEFGREAKEEARKKKLGIMSKKYKAEDQPWILKTCGSTVKKFKGIREGGVSQNTSYYVFTHAENHVIEAFPLHEWYKFQPIQRYKTLSAEEAEHEFNKRDKHLNYFTLMLRKRLKGEDDGDIDDGEEKIKKASKKKSKDLTISEMDEWIDSSDEESSEEEHKEEKDEEEDKKKPKKVDAQKKKKKRKVEDEAFEDSDDGDDEGREMDYISDSSDSEPENLNLESVAEEKALRKLLTSDEGSDNESEKSDKDDNNEDEENKEKETDKTEAEKDKKRKKKSKKDPKIDSKKEKGDSNSDFSSDSSSDEEARKKKKPKKDDSANSADSSRCTTPTTDDNKKKIVSDALGGPLVKKPKLDTPLSSHSIPGLSESGITEDAVRKYLMRKPMTTTELLQKFKSKKTGLSSEQLVNVMTLILKKINPVRQTTKGKMYLSIKS